MQIITQPVDDIPLIISYLIKNQIDLLIDKHLGNHGNRNTLSNGDVAIIWLAYIMSQGDHRKAHVKEWVFKHQIVLSGCIGKHVDKNNFTDDRLTRLLWRCSADNNWENLEMDLAHTTMSIIPTEIALEHFFEKEALENVKAILKLDSTSVAGHHEVSEEGLMQYGYSKDYRPDLPQVKLMSCVEGYSGCPLVNKIDSGNINDELMYEPILNQVRKTFSTEGFLYCGDSKMSMSKIRKGISANKEFYLCPLQFSNSKIRELFKEEWIINALDGSKEIINIYENEELIAYGYEMCRNEQDLTNNHSWTERVLIVKSLGYYGGEKKKFDRELTKIQNEISKLTSKKCKNAEEAERHLKELLEQKLNNYENFKSFFKIECENIEITKEYNRNEIRNGIQRKGSYALKSFRAIVKKITILENEKEEYLKKIGWRAFVTNIPNNYLSFTKAYLYYRKTQYVIESGFHTLKGVPLGIRPLHVWREDQIKGLIRFLGLGVHFLKIMALELRVALKKNNEEIMGLTAGQPKRKTSTPTTISVLSYLSRQGISLSCVKIDNDWRNIISPLPELCVKVLYLLGLTDEVYTKLNEWKFQNNGLIY